jgi:hypothetical protein
MDLEQMRLSVPNIPKDLKSGDENVAQDI